MQIELEQLESQEFEDVSQQESSVSCSETRQYGPNKFLHWKRFRSERKVMPPQLKGRARMKLSIIRTPSQKMKKSKRLLDTRMDRLCLTRGSSNNKKISILLSRSSSRREESKLKTSSKMSLFKQSNSSRADVDFSRSSYTRTGKKTR